MGLFDFLKPKDPVPYDKIHADLDVFTAASLAMPKMNNPFLFDDKSKHPMIFGYFMGVVDYIARVYKLSDKEKHKVCTQYLLKNFADNDTDRVKELLKYCDEVMQKEDGSNYALRGKLAMKKWKEGGTMADYATMGLIRILND
ncbi:MAG: hypothetical protein EP216_02065 [Epsilonproteobacteria bacterium]|nr:MAG: hypothetical protein EP216_02065 [Campylobacterota bacterium]